MPKERARGLVVRGADWSETSRIVTLFTREFGTIRGLAKGGRRLKSSFEFSLDLLTVCEVMFIRKPSGLELLTEARRLEHFPQILRNLDLLNIGYYAAELLSLGTQEYDPHPGLYDAALSLLRCREARAENVLAFELVWLRELGYSPRLEECNLCSQALPELAELGDRVGFSPECGGVICSACWSRPRDVRMLTAAAWQRLRALSRGEPSQSELPLGPRLELRGLLGHLVASVLGRRPKLAGEIDRL